MLLAGDIGGTKTLLALYAPATGARQPVAEAEFHSASYPGLDVMAREFLAQGKEPAGLCLLRRGRTGHRRSRAPHKSALGSRGSAPCARASACSA